MKEVPIRIDMRSYLFSHGCKRALLMLAALASFSVNAQQVKIVTQQNSLPKEYQDLLGDLDKKLLPEAYEYVLWPPIQFMTADGSKSAYIKVALPTNTLNNAKTDYEQYAASNAKMNIFDLKVNDANGNSATISKNSILLGGSIKIAPPERCYLSVDEYKKDKTMKPYTSEDISTITSLKYIDTLKGELKNQKSIVVNLDQLHCGVTGSELLGKNYGPWIDLTWNDKPIYCAIDFAFKCATVDELTLIKNYMPSSANYLVQGYTNPANRNLLNEIRPDGFDAVTGSKDAGIPGTIFNDLESIEKYDNSKLTMYYLFNRVIGQSLVQSVISLAAMHEAFETGTVCGAGRKAALTSYIKSRVTQNYEQIEAGVNETIEKYIKIVPCGTYFFEPATVEKNAKEFNAVINEINQYCGKAFQEYQAATTYFTSSAQTSASSGDLSGLDQGLVGLVRQEQQLPKDFAALKAEGQKISDQNITAAQYLLQKLMATAYFKFFYADTFSSKIGKFDINKCVQGSGIISALTMENIPSDTTERLTLLQTSAKELMDSAAKSINDLLDTKNTIIYSSNVDEEKDNHKARQDWLVDSLLSYTLSFKQYKSIMLPSSREYLLSTKLIGKVFEKDQSRANWNKAIGIGASIIAVAGGLLALTGVGAPAGSLLASLSAAVNSWAVLAASTSIIMVNAGVNWDKAVTEKEYAQIAGATELRQDAYNYTDLVKAEDEKSAAISDAITNISFIALPIGAYAALKKMPAVVKVLGLGKAGIKEEQALVAFDKGSALYKGSGLADKTFGTFVSAKIEDDALFKSIIGSADDPSQIIKNAAAVKTADQYDNFMKELNNGINEKGVVDYKQLEVSTLPEKKVPAEKVPAVTTQITSTTTPEDVLKQFNIPVTDESLEKLDYMMNNAYTTKIDAATLSKMSQKDFAAEWQTISKKYALVKDQNSLAKPKPSEFKPTQWTDKINTIEEAKKAPITGDPDELWMRVTTKDDVVDFLKTYKSTPRTTTLTTQISGKTINIGDDVLDKIQKFVAYATKNNYDYEVGGILSYKETNNVIEVIDFIPRESAAVSIPLNTAIDGYKYANLGTATQLTKYPSMYADDVIRNEIFGISKNTAEYDALRDIKPEGKYMDFHSHYVYSDYQKIASPLDYRDYITSVFTPGKGSNRDFNLLFITKAEDGTDLTQVIKFSDIKATTSEYAFIKDVTLTVQKDALSSFLTSLETKGIKAGTDEYKELMTSLEKLHTADGDILDATSAKFKAYVETKAEYTKLLDKHGVYNPAKTAKTDLKPLLDTGVLGQWEDGIYVDDRFFIPEKPGSSVYVRPGSTQRYIYNEQTKTMTALTGTWAKSPYYKPDTTPSYNQRHTDFWIIDDYELVEGTSDIYYKKGDYRTIGSGKNKQRITFFTDPKTGYWQSKQDIISNVLYSTAEEQKIADLSPEEQLAWKKESEKNKITPSVDVFSKNVKDTNPKISLEEYFPDKKVTTINTEVNPVTTISTKNIPKTQKLTRAFLTKIKADPDKLEKGFKYIISKNGEVYLLDINTTEDAVQAFITKNALGDIVDKGTVKNLGSRDIQVISQNNDFSAKDYLLKQIDSKNDAFFPKTTYTTQTVKTVEKPDVTKYYIGEETTVPIKYEKVSRNFGEEYTYTVMEKLYGKYSTKAPYKLSPEIIEGAVETGELGTNKHNLKYFIKTDGTIEVTSDHAHHVETTNGYVNKDINFIRGYGNVYTRDEIINGDKVMRIYLSPRNGAAGLDLDKYLDDYIRYIYKDAGKELPFIESDGKLYYKAGAKTSSSYLDGGAQKYAFVTDATITEQKDALKTFFSGLESKGITPTDDLMAAFNDVHKADGFINDPTSAKYQKYIIAKDKYAAFLKEKGVSDPVKTARLDLKPLLNTGVLGQWEEGKYVSGRLFIPEKAGSSVYVRPGNSQRYLYNEQTKTMTALQGSWSQSPYYKPDTTPSYKMRHTDLWIADDYELVEGSTNVYYKKGDYRTFGDPPQRVTYAVNPANGYMESTFDVMNTGDMANLKKTDIPKEELIKYKKETSKSGEISYLDYFEGNNVSMLNTNVTEYTKVSTHPDKLQDLDRTYLTSIKNSPEVLEKGFKYFIEKNGTVYLIDLDGEVHLSVFARKGLTEVVDAGLMDHLATEEAFSVRGRNANFKSKEFMVDYIKSKVPDFFTPSKYSPKTITTTNDAGLNPLEYGATKYYTVEAQSVTRDEGDAYWFDTYYKDKSLFKDKGANEEASFASPYDLSTDVIDQGLKKIDFDYPVGMRYYLDKDGSIKVSSLVAKHQEIMQKYYMGKKDLLDYGYIRFTNSSGEIINGEKLYQLGYSSMIGGSGFETDKYMIDYITALYKQKNETMPFKNIDGKLYYKPAQ